MSLFHQIRDWSVVRWSVDEGDTEPTPGVTYSGDQDGARRVFARYAEAGAVVELRYQPPPVRQPERIIDHTHKTARCGINVWITARRAEPCFLPKGHDGPHRRAADQGPTPTEVEALRAEVEALRTAARTVLGRLRLPHSNRARDAEVLAAALGEDRLGESRP